MLTRQSADPGKTLDFNRPSLGKAVQRLCSDRACNTQSSGAPCRRIKKRQPVWSELVSLLQHAKVLGPYAELKMDANAVRDHRTLLTDPDPVRPLPRSFEARQCRDVVGDRRRIARRSGGVNQQPGAGRTRAQPAHAAHSGAAI